VELGDTISTGNTGGRNHLRRRRRDNGIT